MAGLDDGGKVFDSSYKRNQTPPHSRSTASSRGGQEGMQLVGAGGMIELEIPSDLGYGPRGAPPVIPGNAHFAFPGRVAGRSIASRAGRRRSTVVAFAPVMLIHDQSHVDPRLRQVDSALTTDGHRDKRIIRYEDRSSRSYCCSGRWRWVFRYHKCGPWPGMSSGTSCAASSGTRWS